MSHWVGPRNGMSRNKKHMNTCRVGWVDNLQSPLSGLKGTLDSSEKERENGLIEKAFPFFHGWAVKLCPH